MVNKKQELIEAIDKLQDSQVVKFNNRVVDLSMSLHRSELRLILKEDYQEKICTWKSVHATKDCDMEKDKGCKITKPDKIGEEKIYLLEKVLTYCQSLQSQIYFLT